MPILKAIVGHGASVRATIAYLTRDGRAVASDFLHCAEVDARGDPVWRQMDDARRLIGTDVPVGGRPVRTWQHFVVSPDPDDHVDLQTLRDLSLAWVRRYFGDFQAAIYYHDDNALGIPHAHVIVNNPNLATGGRVSSSLGRADLREAYLGLQDMAEERELGRLPDWGRGRGSKGSVQPTYRTRDDVEIEERGISWKKDVRDRMACAMRLSETEDDYVDACRALGLTVRVSRARRLAGEYVYGHPASGCEVAGSTLGSSWSRDGVTRRIADDLVRGVTKPRGEARERLLEAMGSLETADGTMALQVIGTTHGIGVTAEMVSEMVDACAEWDVASLADFDEALSEARGPRDVRLLTDARDLAASLGWLPGERDVEADGWRVGHGGAAANAVDAPDDDWWRAPDHGVDYDAPEYGAGEREAEPYVDLGWRDEMGEW